MSSDGEDGKFKFGFFLGGLIGALVIIFLGTKEGKKTGKQLQSKGKEILDELQKALDELENKEKVVSEKSSELKKQVKEKLKDVESLSNEDTKKIDTALTHIEKLQERGRKSTASLRKRLFKNIPKKK